MKIDQVSRKVMDQWPIDRIGLPARAVHGAQREGATVAGDIRGWPEEKWLGMDHFGVTSLKEVQDLFALFTKLESGDVECKTIQDVFQLLLSAREREVIVARYGLQDASAAGPRRLTLQAIADRTQHTRERIRQIQESALNSLSGPCAAHLINPFATLIEDKIARTLQGSAKTSELDGALKDPALGKFRPGGLLSLLCDVMPRRFTEKNNFFSILSSAQLDDMERAALKVLGKSEAPVKLTAIIQGMSVKKAKNLTDDRIAKAVRLQLESNPDVAAFKDGSFFLFEKGATTWLANWLAGQRAPVKYANILKAFNQALLPTSQKTGASIRRFLRGPSIVLCGDQVYAAAEPRRAVKR